MTGRAELERRVDALAAEHSGPAFAEAIKELFAGLGPHDREGRREIVLARAANVDQAVMDRVDARGWLRRQWDRAGSPERR
jgi:hypothetical protein